MNALATLAKRIVMTHSRRWWLLFRRAIPLIMFIAMGTTALVHPNVTWTSAALSITVAMPLLVSVCAVFGNRQRRAFRGGFAILGGGYFLLLWLGYPTAGNYGGLSSFVNKMATSKALYLLHDRLFPSSSLRLVPDGMQAAGFGGGFGGASGGFGSGGGGFGGGGAFQMPADPFADEPAPNAMGGTTVSGSPPNLMEDYQTAENFLIIGQCLWAWILGWLGGLFAQFVARRQAKPPTLKSQI